MKSLAAFGFFLFGLAACAKLTSSSGALPPGEPPDDNNTPSSSSPSGNNSIGSGPVQQSESGENGALATHLPSQTPSVPQNTTSQTYVPGG